MLLVQCTARKNKSEQECITVVKLVLLVVNPSDADHQVRAQTESKVLGRAHEVLAVKFIIFFFFLAMDCKRGESGQRPLRWLTRL